MLLARSLFALDPYDDRIYTPSPIVVMDPAASGGTDAALKIPTVFRAVNVLAAAVATLPVDVHRYVDRAHPDKGKEVATSEPWRRKLRRKPNRLQTSFRWRHHMVGHLILGGNYYAHKVGLPGAPPDQLWPLDPARIRPIDLEADGSLVYRYTKRNGEPEILHQDELLHVRGFSRDGMLGLSVLELMRDMTQLALANRAQRTSFVKNEMRPSVVIKHPGELGETGKTVLQKGFKRAFGGTRNAGEVLVLDEGMELTPFGVTSKDAQYIESEHFLIEEFLRMTGVPGVMVGHGDKTATYASAEQFFQSFADHCVFPIIANIEQELTLALFGEDEDDLFVEFNLNGLMRPDSAARAAFYRAMVELGILTRNEVRALENRNPLPGLDEPLTPKNMGGAEPGGGAPAGPPAPARRPTPAPQPPPEEDEARSRAHAIVLEAAARLVRKEIAALQTLAKRAQEPAWSAEVRAFYEKHAELLVEALKLPLMAARVYCDRQVTEATRDMAIAAAWLQERPAQLAALAIGEPVLVRRS